MSDPTTDPFADDVGAYVLGILEAAERAAFAAHLRACPACQEAVAELEDLPGLLALVPAEGPADPPPTVLAGVLAEVRRLEDADEVAARRRRRARTWAGVGVAAAAVVGVSLGTGVLPVPWSGDQGVEEGRAEATTVELLGGDVPVTASVELRPVRWGTELELSCSYTGAYTAAEYALVVHDAAGGSEQVATWQVVPGADVTIPAATAIPLADITRVEMLLEGRVVLAADLDGAA